MTATEEPCDYILKFLVLGDTGVGKTSLLTRYVENRFSSTFSTTVGVDFCQKKIKYLTKDGNTLNVQLQLWDTAGQERFRSLTSSFFRDAMGFLLVFDITNESSFHHINDWLTQLHAHCYDDKPPVVIIGNKVDQADLRSVSKETGEALSCELGYHYVETSALDSTNVNEAVDILLDLVVDRITDGSLADENRNYLTIAPNQIKRPKEKQSSCSC